jgi:phage N-6-adenine-methyltransferase
MANSEACQLFIEQQIEEGIIEGKTPYSIGKELSAWVEKLFKTKIRPNTLEVRAHRAKEKLLTNVSSQVTNGNVSGYTENQVLGHGGMREGSGRPAKYDQEELPHFRARGTGENEWYTPDKYIELARSVLGEIELDPASSERSQERIKARAYYTKEDNGLTKPWFGSVWLNPPYSQPEMTQFIEKLVKEVRVGKLVSAIMLTHNYTDTSWFHLAESVCSAICFTRGRIAFEGSDGTKAAPTQGQAFFYFGPNVDKFKEVFLEVGFVR